MEYNNSRIRQTDRRLASLFSYEITAQFLRLGRLFLFSAEPAVPMRGKLGCTFLSRRQSLLLSGDIMPLRSDDS